MQLQELVDVRHSVFIIGNAGTGKTCVWKSLVRANKNMGHKPMVVDLNPKAVTNDELFGVINQATQDLAETGFPGRFDQLESCILIEISGGAEFRINLQRGLSPLLLERFKDPFDGGGRCTPLRRREIQSNKLPW